MSLVHNLEESLMTGHLQALRMTADYSVCLSGYFCKMVCLSLV